MYQSLAKCFSSVEPLGPISLPRFLRIVLKISQIFFEFIFKGNYNLSHSLLRSWYYGKVVNKCLLESHFDLIFAPVASCEIAFLKTKTPIYYLSDSSFDQMLGYYSYFSTLNKISSYEGSQIEGMALSNAKRIIYSSDWASNFVVTHYSVPTSKIRVYPFGANIDNPPSLDDISIKLSSITKCNLVFIGLNWIEKGGNIAYDTFIECKRLGLETTLTICGCTPPSFVIDQAEVEVFPFLDKNIAADYEQFISILTRSHFLLLPTRFECTAIVLCEASAFGLPSLTTETGGLASVIENGINGFRFDLDDQGDLYARYILDLFRTPGKYKQMVYSTRARYDSRLNWDSWGNSMLELITSDFLANKHIQ